jgi:hypothetical protein
MRTVQLHRRELYEILDNPYSIAFSLGYKIFTSDNMMKIPELRIAFVVAMMLDFVILNLMIVLHLLIFT